MKKQSQQATQQQAVTQQTSVTVQNIIEAPKLDAVEKFKLFSDVLANLETKAAPAPQGTTAVIVQDRDPIPAALKDPNTWILVAAGALGLVLIAKRV